MLKRMNHRISNAAHGMAEGVYKATHYSTYHSYRKSLKFVNRYLAVGIVAFVIGLTPLKFAWLEVIESIGLFIIMTFFLAYYWVISKSRVLKKDAKKSMNMISRGSYVSHFWYMYDGIYATQGVESIELVFYKDRNFAAALWKLMTKAKPTIPPKPEDIEALKEYLIKLSKVNLPNEIGINTSFIAYGTMDEKLAQLLEDKGFDLTKLDDDYITKPSRFDYAATTGSFKGLIADYPQEFNAYLIAFDERVFTRQKEKEKHQKAKQHKLNQKLKKLEANTVE